jgi:pimeloyl-ACP methyl ester carboxylesterase
MAMGDDTTEMEAAYEKFSADKSIANLLQLRSYVSQYHPQTVTKDISAMAALTSPIAGVDDIRWYMVQIGATMGDTRYEELVEKPLGQYMMDFNALEYNDNYQMPVLLLSGSCDWICPVGLVKEYAQCITAPNVEVNLIEGCGHSPQGQLPKEFADRIKAFLEK